MKRSIRININYANKSKLNTIDLIIDESIKVINLYIDNLWNSDKKNNKFIDFKVESWLSARMLQCLGKQALEIVKSQRKKKKQTKPVMKFPSINLDSRMIDIQFNLNSFDIWIKLSSIGNKIKLNIPSKKFKLFEKYKTWKQLSFIRLLKLEDKYYIDFIYEKEIDKQENNENQVGIDIGYKKLIVSSSGNIYGKEMLDLYDKISKKKQGSKSFKKSLKFRDNQINKFINEFISDESPSSLIIEDLKNVKHKSKLNHKIMNKVQHWTYSKVINKLENITDERGISLVKVSPTYTSQQCSNCGSIHKESRQGEIYKCVVCGTVIDADFNASINILHRGAYNPSTSQKSIY